MNEKYEVTLHGGPYDKRKIFVNPRVKVCHMPKMESPALSLDALDSIATFKNGTEEYYEIDYGFFVYKDEANEELKKYAVLESQFWATDNTEAIECLEQIMYQQHNAQRAEILFTIKELVAIDLNILHAQGQKILDQEVIIRNLRESSASVKDTSEKYRKALQYILGEDVNVYDYAMRLAALDIPPQN
jgi:hypothetical protein